MNQLLHNIDGVRAEIMRLESAPVFDAEAWARVLADLGTAGRVSALADAKRRMETAKQNQPAMIVGVDFASGDDQSLVLIVCRCGKEIKNTMEVEYSRFINEFFCSPDCATDRYFEYMESCCVDMESSELPESIDVSKEGFLFRPVAVETVGV